MDFFINYGGISYLTLFGSEKYDAIYDRIRYLKEKEKKKSKYYHHIYIFLTILQM